MCPISGVPGALAADTNQLGPVSVAYGFLVSLKITCVLLLSTYPSQLYEHKIWIIHESWQEKLRAKSFEGDFAKNRGRVLNTYEYSSETCRRKIFVRDLLPCSHKILCALLRVFIRKISFESFAKNISRSCKCYLSFCRVF
jgi:hypothetical protein